MTGPSAAASSDDGLGRDPQPTTGLRAAARRLWRGPADEPAAAEEQQVGTPPDQSADAGPVPRPPDATVPPLLQQAAAWSWRLLLTGLIIYLAFRFAVELRLVVLPFIAAMLLTSLLQPMTSWLKRRGLAPLLATWCTFLAALLVIAGAITLFANRVSADYQTLAGEVTKTAHEVQRSLAGPPFRLNATRLQHLTNELVTYMTQHKAQIAGTVLTGGKYALELAAGLVLTLFIAFFLLKDGARIWAWLIKGLRPENRRRADKAGQAAWKTLTNYIRGTTLVAAIHALFIGLALWLLGVPLLVPFIVLIFLAAFVPIIGILVVGALAILVTLATKGWVAAVILLAVFILENQIEGHLLQPLVVGRLVRLHPLAIILALSVGGILAGIPGAIIAVPFAAVITYAWAALRADEGPG
ncbi:MAG TPA: AI-2E family transporter [Streptosporangiaceae bacterium]|nr:AI-2E family transporter [Streptosporangiaceae bacterium]